MPPLAMGVRPLILSIEYYRRCCQQIRLEYYSWQPNPVHHCQYYTPRAQDDPTVWQHHHPGSLIRPKTILIGCCCYDCIPANH